MATLAVSGRLANDGTPAGTASASTLMVEAIQRMPQQAVGFPGVNRCCSSAPKDIGRVINLLEMERVGAGAIPAEVVNGQPVDQGSDEFAERNPVGV